MAQAADPTVVLAVQTLLQHQHVRLVEPIVVPVAEVSVVVVVPVVEAVVEDVLGDAAVDVEMHIVAHPTPVMHLAPVAKEGALDALDARVALEVVGKPKVDRAVLLGDNVWSRY